MAKHSKTSLSEVIKTYSFKLKSINGFDREKLIKAIDEYHNYYNLCSDWIKGHLTTKIGDLVNLIPEDKRSEAKYMKTLISEEWKDKPMYMMFKKSYPANDRDNAIYKVIESINPEKYNGNILGFSVTYYRRFGYVASVISNYVTKISKMSTGVKRHAVTDESDENAICEQTIYEMERNSWTSAEGWKERIEYLELKSDCNESQIERLKTLFDYYTSHSNEINEKMETMAIDSLIKFGGCHRNDSKKSMYIMGTTNCPFSVVQTNGNFLNIKFSNIIDVDVFGRRDVVKDGNLLFDITNNHGDSFVLKIVNGEIYIDINCKVPFEKTISSTDKVVGIDINIKHMLLATDILDDGNVNEYVNIYKAAIEDSGFRTACNADTLRNFEDLSKFVSFCPLEFELLFSRVSKQMGIADKYTDSEIAFSNVLYSLKKKFIEQGDNVKRIYVENVLKLRAQVKSYAVMKDVYYNKQHQYDIDKSEEFIRENPFSSTECGKEILSKINHIGQKIIGCRNNIIQYAYRVFGKNDYSMVSLEKLTSSQFEKVKSLPSINSLLNYHKVMGCTNEELSEKEVYSLVKKGYYDFEYDGDKISNAKLSEDGKLAKIRDDFFNLMIKSIHFAEIKDYFITLSNNGNIGISLVAPYFTSQMDSIGHKIYCEKDKKTGNLKLVNKKKIRHTQERHINGLNADYNAARNISYLTSNDTLRGMFMKAADSNKSMYNKPLYETFVKSQASVISKMKKEGMVSVIES